MTTAVLVPPSGATVSVASTSSSSKDLSASTTLAAGNKNNLDGGRDTSSEEHSTGDANAKLSATSAADAASAHVDDNTENANTANITSSHSTNVGASSSATRSVNHLKRCKSTPETTGASKLKKRRRVSFESADIVEFEPTVFTTTVTSGGIPLGMSLTERSRSRRRLDSWELEREDLRVGRQNYMEEGYLDVAEREQILNTAGCAEQSMLTVEAEVNEIIAHRRESNEVDFDFVYGLVSIGEEGDDDEDDEEEDEEVDEEEEEEVEEVQLLSNVGTEEDSDVLER